MTLTAPRTAPAPGLYPGVPFADYLAWPLPSQSSLKEGRNSMAHLHAAELGERVKAPTDDMLLGSALHTCFLEPELMPDHVALWTGERRAGAVWRAFCAEHEGKVILTRGLHEKLMGMLPKLRRHPFVREWAARIEHVECAVVGEMRGVAVKGRCDALTPEPMVDIKKVRTTDPAAFTRALVGFGYHLQASMYRRLFNRERFVLLLVEDEPPFDVVPYELSPAFLRAGARELDTLLDRYKFCRDRGAWPGRSEDPEPVLLEPPDWLVGEDAGGITIGGVGAFEED
jgi:hypothetical protein